MDQKRFDLLATYFGQRRSRRDALRTAAAGAGAVALAGRVTSAQAQDATPEANPISVESGSTQFMFVQTLGAGSIDAATDGVESLLLVADHLAGQTLFFSDRPERIVGMVPTGQFLTGGRDGEGFGFTPTDPPNAALVLPDGQILIVELFDPQYDAATGEVRYQMRALEDITQIDLSLEREPLAREDAVGDFTAASLFIDDCPDGQVICIGPAGNQVGSIPASGSMGFCWDSGSLCCRPCDAPPGGGDTWDSGCDFAFPSQAGCEVNCTHTLVGAFSCDS